MKLYIGSDIHGSEANVNRFVAKWQNDSECDKLKAVLLGDIYNHGPRNPFPEGYAPMKVASVLNGKKENIRVIKGNCDSEVDEMISEFALEPDFQIVDGTRTLWFTHGHKHNPDIPYENAAAGDIVFYGHFHRAAHRVVDGVHYVCVGALGLSPEGVERSYAILCGNNVKILALDSDSVILSFSIN